MERIADAEWLGEVMSVGALADENYNDLERIKAQYPDLPAEVVAYLDLSANMIKTMSGTMGRMAALISRMEDLIAGALDG